MWFFKVLSLINVFEHSSIGHLSLVESFTGTVLGIIFTKHRLKMKNKNKSDKLLRFDIKNYDFIPNYVKSSNRTLIFCKKNCFINSQT